VPSVARRAGGRASVTAGPSEYVTGEQARGCRHRDPPRGSGSPSPAAGVGRIRTGVAGAAWLEGAAGGWCVMALATLILTVPWWQMADVLDTFALHGDDFCYIGASLDWATFQANLLRPHNTHVVPMLPTLDVRRGRGGGQAGEPAGGLSRGILLRAGGGDARRGGSSRRARVVRRRSDWRDGVPRVLSPCRAGGDVVFRQSGSLGGDSGRYDGPPDARMVAKRGGLAPRIGLPGGPGGTGRLVGWLVAGPAAVAYLAVKDPSRFRRPILVLAAVTTGVVLVVLIAPAASSPGQTLCGSSKPGSGRADSGGFSLGTGRRRGALPGQPRPGRRHHALAGRRPGNRPCRVLGLVAWRVAEGQSA
jgi:hypothetical protein